VSLRKAAAAPLEQPDGQAEATRNQCGLVDEVVLMVCPVLVGAGKRLFEDGQRTTPRLVGAKEFPEGVMAPAYAPTV
jgi:dihydrofolate reductase